MCVAVAENCVDVKKTSVICEQFLLSGWENMWPRAHDVCIAQYTVGWLEEKDEHIL